jgi:hypothetical protein
LAGAGTAPVVIEIGAGTAIPTVRHFSRRVIRQHNGTLVRINLREPDVDRFADVGVGLGALEALRAIDSALRGPAKTRVGAGCAVNRH